MIDIAQPPAMIECPAIRTVAALDEEAVTMSHQNAFYAEVGRRVRHARATAGLTQDTLAARVALSRTSVTNIEVGRQKMMLHTLWDLAAALGVEPATLLPDARDALGEADEGRKEDLSARPPRRARRRGRCGPADAGGPMRWERR
jgi:transcriptional regulator with XRE-family HTH domain